MKLKLIRKYKCPNYTIGHLYINDKYFCDTLEDKVRQLDSIDDKIKANYSFVATIVVEEQESGTTILHFDVPVTANVTISDSKLLDGPPYPIKPDRVYVGYIYDGQKLQGSKILSVG